MKRRRSYARYNPRKKILNSVMAVLSVVAGTAAAATLGYVAITELPNMMVSPCDTGNVGHYTAIMLDSSDPYTVSQISFLEKDFYKRLNQSSSGDYIQVLTLNEDMHLPVVGASPICSPGGMTWVNSSPGEAMSKELSLANRQLSNQLQQGLQPTPKRKSPIIESFPILHHQATAVDADDGRRVVYVSDFLQHSPGGSIYGSRKKAMLGESGRKFLSRYKFDADGAVYELLVIYRQKYHEQQKIMVSLLTDYLERSGAQVSIQYII